MSFSQIRQTKYDYRCFYNMNNKFITRDSIDMIYSLQDRCYDLQNQERITEFQCQVGRSNYIFYLFRN